METNLNTLKDCSLDTEQKLALAHHLLQLVESMVDYSDHTLKFSGTITIICFSKEEKGRVQQPIGFSHLWYSALRQRNAEEYIYT